MSRRNGRNGLRGASRIRLHRFNANRRRVARPQRVRLILLILVALVTAALATVVGGAGTALAGAYGVYRFYAEQLPPPESIGLVTAQSFQTSTIYDRTGRVALYELFDKRTGMRTHVPIDQMPEHLKLATIAVEDRSFYTNPGINVRGLARAAVAILRGGFAGGGSSITQQLVKNALIAPEERYEPSIGRKIKEIILSLEISRRYSKDQILEMYLNTISYGNLAYGVSAAADIYFGKPVAALTLAESAFLAGLPQSPAAYNPYEAEGYLAAKRRQEVVLGLMLDAGFLTPQEAEAARAAPLEFYRPTFDIRAPHFVFYVRKELEEMFGPELLYQGGLKVITTLDLELQGIAQEEARRRIEELQQEDCGCTNASLVAIDPRTGEIKAMLGSLDYFDETIDGQVNIATANRQPGSSFKPITYATAFGQGYTPATMVLDIPKSYPQEVGPPYSPANYDRKFHGPQSLRTALASSYNIPAVEVMSWVGAPSVVETAHRLGITTLNRQGYGLALTLGGGEVKLLDLTYAYGVFGNGGLMAGQAVPEEDRRPGHRRLDPVAILRVEDPQGRVLYQYAHPETEQVLDPRLAYLVTDILSDRQARMPAFGSPNPLELSRRAAAKTGTTDDYRDSWTLGYAPQLVTGVWVGNADNKEMNRVAGSLGAAPIWQRFMERALAGEPEMDFPVPPGIVRREICFPSGLLPAEACQQRRSEVFIQGTEPTAQDTIYQSFAICQPTGLLATVHCPPDQVETKVFPVYPAELADWLRQNEVPQPPSEYDTTYGPGQQVGEVAITGPAAYGYVRGQVSVEGTARGEGLRRYWLEVGQGLNPAAWTRVAEVEGQPVEQGLLGLWDATGLEGIYTLQLVREREDGSTDRASVVVTVDETPPTLEVLYPQPGWVYDMKSAGWATLQVEAADNLSVQKVEYFVDGQSVGYTTVAPWSLRWTLSRGRHEVHAVVTDGAANTVESPKIPITVVDTSSG